MQHRPFPVHFPPVQHIPAIELLSRKQHLPQGRQAPSPLQRPCQQPEHRGDCLQHRHLPLPQPPGQQPHVTARSRRRYTQRTPRTDRRQDVLQRGIEGHRRQLADPDSPADRPVPDMPVDIMAQALMRPYDPLAPACRARGIKNIIVVRSLHCHFRVLLRIAAPLRLHPAVVSLFVPGQQLRRRLRPSDQAALRQRQSLQYRARPFRQHHQPGNGYPRFGQQRCGRLPLFAAHHHYLRMGLLQHLPPPCRRHRQVQRKVDAS